jgi:hypothetical protein
MAPRERGNGLPKDDNSDMNKKGRKGQRSWRQQPFPDKVGLRVKYRGTGKVGIARLIISAVAAGPTRELLRKVQGLRFKVQGV